MSRPAAYCFVERGRISSPRSSTCVVAATVVFRYQPWRWSSSHSIGRWVWKSRGGKPINETSIYKRGRGIQRRQIALHLQASRRCRKRHQDTSYQPYAPPESKRVLYQHAGRIGQTKAQALVYRSCSEPRSLYCPRTGTLIINFIGSMY